MGVFLFRHVTISPAAPGRIHTRAWRTVRRAFLQAYPTCAACGSRSRVRAHHVVPVSVDPSRELDPNNLLPLCESYEQGVNCHLFFGHGGTWQQVNPNAVADAFNWRAARTIRPA